MSSLYQYARYYTWGKEKNLFWNIQVFLWISGISIFMLINEHVLPRLGWFLSIALQCFIYNGLLWHVLPLSKNCISNNLDIVLGRIAVLIILWFIVQ